MRNKGTRVTIALVTSAVIACGGDAVRDDARDALDSASAFARDSAGAVNRGEVPEPAGAGATIDSTGDNTDNGAAAGNDGAPAVAPSGTSAWTSGIAERKSTSGVGTLTAVRVARQEGFDRMVFEFGAGAAPGYHVSYVDRPVRTCGSGEVVPLPGDGWLEIRMQPAQAHKDAGQPTITERTRPLTLPNLKQITMTCDFEADVTWVAGVLSPNDFRVLSLQNPARLVVDIRHR